MSHFDKTSQILWRGFYALMRWFLDASIQRYTTKVSWKLFFSHMWQGSCDQFTSSWECSKTQNALYLRPPSGVSQDEISQELRLVRFKHLMQKSCKSQLPVGEILDKSLLFCRIHACILTNAGFEMWHTALKKTNKTSEWNVEYTKHSWLLGVHVHMLHISVLMIGMSYELQIWPWLNGISPIIHFRMWSVLFITIERIPISGEDVLEM